MGFLFKSGEVRLTPYKNELGKKHRNILLLGGFGLFALPYGDVEDEQGCPHIWMQKYLV